MKAKSLWRCIALSLVVFAWPPALPAEVPFWKISEVKVGSEGYGCTVFEGLKKEKFGVQVTGVEDSGEGPHFTIKVWKTVDGKKQPFNVASGMSGSPVYIDGKLVGAISAGWRANPEGIVRPFELMWEEEKRAERFRHVHSAIKYPQPAGAGDMTLDACSSIKISFVSGDPDLSTYPFGTVTAVDYETGTVYALGHTMEISGHDVANGSVSFSARAGAVAITVNDGDAHKVAARDNGEGQRARIWYNGLHGIYGTLNEVAEEIPVHLSMSAPGYAKKADCGVPYGIPAVGFVGLATSQFLDSYLEPLGGGPVFVSGEIRIQGRKEPIRFRERFAHSGRATTSFSSEFVKRTSIFGSLNRLMDASEQTKFSGLNLSFRKDAGTSFEISNAVILNSSVEAGGEISLAVQLVEKGELQKTVRRFEPVVTFRIPKDTPEGYGKMIVETGEMFVDRRPEVALPPANMDDLVRQIESSTKDGDSFYVTVMLPRKEEPKSGTGIPGTGEDWRAMASGQTLFNKGSLVLEIRPVKVPFENSLVLGGALSGRTELGFSVTRKPENSGQFLNNFASFILAGIGFPLMVYLSLKLVPAFDALFKAIIGFLTRHWRSLRRRKREFDSRLIS